MTNGRGGRSSDLLVNRFLDNLRQKGVGVHRTDDLMTIGKLRNGRARHLRRATALALLLAVGALAFAAAGLRW